MFTAVLREGENRQTLSLRECAVKNVSKSKHAISQIGKEGKESQKREGKSSCDEM